jgi:hypothetical protein
VLQIAVHGNDDFAPGEIEAGFQSGGLAEISAETNDVDAVVVLVNIG